ncbi:MAG: hypothetical protein LKF87_03770 [Clostridium tyrobutyricum]|jgi:hypothetical protein|uniref:hypothetical protein n=1 Tax=Clostridium tyrobutyricum TaxID=1519 RepID=UPI001C37FF0A|nr:hypothetical protein [Clostridium tyrobutyricum]MBV4447435.1 hypothetical protein [Clostridium tyrobutyricum]MCH4199279.1 hypothetical protein [Clostridium tyrobutyricum]MCH4236611.1 hypothetical protein [Clostridium tyrobutyricum]MCH4258073.1 hypothetical protein [Clostridium tyrobutyricum]MCI1239112.1 hypothetical protein [Clostridium tyrobutyricum]
MNNRNPKHRIKALNRKIAELECQVQTLQDSKKRERELSVEKSWYCTAKHFKSLLEDAKHCRIADFGKPCQDCKYNFCIDGIRQCDMNYAFERFSVLTIATGIHFSPCIKEK